MERNKMNTETPRTDAQSVRYYNDATGNRDEYVKARFARQLERELTALERELTAVTKQRNEARKLAEKYRYLSCDSQEEADAEVLPWENNQPTKL